MADLVIKTADELIALDLEDRWRARRAARETEVSRRILRMFLGRGGPIPVEEVVGAFRDSAPDTIYDALVALDEDDLIRVRDGRVDVAYPFSAAPTPFVVLLPDGAERYACCAIDALGVAPMIGETVEIRSLCRHCDMPLRFRASPGGTEPDAEGVMLWFGKRAEDRRKVFDSL